MDESEARDRLTRLRDEFQATVDAIRERLAQPEREASGDVAIVDQHPADVATETAERELDVSREAMFEARLGQIADALGRLRDGTYGSCADCGQPIPDERLALVPDTPYCVTHARVEQARAN
jgi:RNA polymerase-binding transcription factor DksA